MSRARSVRGAGRVVALSALLAMLGATSGCGADHDPVPPLSTLLPSSEEPVMTAPQNDRPTRSSSRMRAPEVPAVVHQGIRYEQLRAPSSEGLPPGGYVVATSTADGKRLWVARVYDIVIDPSRETDVQIVFFRSMVLSDAGDTLLVEDEKSRRYEVRLQDGSVHVLR